MKYKQKSTFQTFNDDVLQLKSVKSSEVQKRKEIKEQDVTSQPSNVPTVINRPTSQDEVISTPDMGTGQTDINRQVNQIPKSSNIIVITEPVSVASADRYTAKTAKSDLQELLPLDL